MFSGSSWPQISSGDKVMVKVISSESSTVNIQLAEVEV
jgi:hypothetical protein